MVIANAVSLVLSPRAWGWSQSSTWFRARNSVVPTRVGVELPSWELGECPMCCPHARGGGAFQPDV